MTQAPTISVPKGGGALQGIGEKFSPDLFTGTGNFSVPISVPPGRNGFQPQLSLVYSTGNGNGPFGLGWSLSIPGVGRKTSAGIPLGNEDATSLRPGERRDVFILSGAEDLVPVSGSYPGIVRYQPRTEGLFALIEHYRDAANNYWKVSSKDGLTSLYGKPNSDDAKVADPSHPGKVFAWKLTETQDPFGNRIVYEYERDRGTDGPHQWDQVYLKSIRYVDYTNQSGAEKFLVSVTFDYTEEQLPDGTTPSERPDPFSDYRAGFEIRTRRRCKKILIETHPEGANRPIPVRAYEFHYKQDPHNGVSLMNRVDVVGFDDAGHEARELPPLEFGHTRFEPQKRRFEAVTGRDLPARSLANPELELVDLFGNGLPDLLEMNGSVRYWRNRGGGDFDLPRAMRDAPPYALSHPGVQMIDANGDGRADLLVTTAETTGYYPLDFNGQFSRKSYQRYRQAPSFNLKDPEVRLLDLTGDGVTDVLRSGTSFECYFNDPQEGWLPGNTARIQRRRLADFPDVSFADPRVKFADLSGDGMQDIVLVHDGNVEYWPNLGHGRWGKRIHMSNSPRFRDLGYTFGYDPRRILIGDIDGDGLADIVYVGNRKVTLWINRSGNAWSDPIEIHGTPSVTDMDAVRLVDLYGTGVSGVLWSSDAQGSGRPHLFFLDFTGGVKPYLLNEMDNNIGAVTKVEYVSSTREYLRDQANRATRWRTPLPFPVQVVSRVEVIDGISQGKLTTKYRYRHGYWDGAEREFRGFGMVEQLDTQSFAEYSAPGLHSADTRFAAVEGKYFSHPTLIKTWFHQGPVGEEFGDWEEQDYTDEYWPGDPQILNHTASVNEFLVSYNDRGAGGIPSPRNRRIKRDALRTMRGSILRTELYALDGSPLEDRPYTVTEHAYGLREEQVPTGVATSRLRIFFPYAIAQRTTQWERGDDPMTVFSFTGDYDPYGQPLSQSSFAMPRRTLKWAPRRGNTVADETGILATHVRTAYAAPAAGVARALRDRVAHATSFTFEQKPTVVESQPNDVKAVLRDQHRAAERLHAKFESDLKHWRPSQGAPAGYVIFGHTVNFYDGTAYDGLALGTVGPYGALTRSEALVFTDDILDRAYNDSTAQRRPAYPGGVGGNPPAGWPANFGADHGYLDQLNPSAGYVPGYYGITGQQKFDFQAGASRPRGLVVAMRDPLNHESRVRYDPTYSFLPVEVRDPKSLTVTAEYTNNLRVLQPWKVTDPNGNFTEVAFSPLGLVTKTWVKGKNGEGDQNEPGSTLTYDFHAFRDHGKPIYVRAVKRCHHDTETDVRLRDRDKTIESREYSDGFGRIIQTRTQGEELRFGHATLGGGETVLPALQTAGRGAPVVGTATNANRPNVIVSGWQVYDNKGKVVEKYEPFFSEGWDFEPESQSRQGVHIEMYYDPRGQVIRTVNPDRSEQRVIYGIPRHLDRPEDYFTPTPWEMYTYDPNDNAGRTHPTSSGDYSHQYNTPGSALIDALGRTLEVTQRNRVRQSANVWGAIEEYRTTSAYDIQGNLVALTDTLGREAFHYVYDLAKRTLRIDSIDAGQRWMVLNAAGSEIERRDGKGAITLRTYDVLNRPKTVRARNNASQPITLREEMTYGDDRISSLTVAQKAALNLFGKLYKHRDEAGILTFTGPNSAGQLTAYDFKGNGLEKRRQVIADSAIAAQINTQPGPEKSFVVDWDNPPTLEGGYQTSAAYDALNRLKWMRYPRDVNGDREQLVPAYNRAGALETVTLDQANYVERIAYNAKGQRVLIAYGNGLMTRYAYDPTTFRLVRLRTEKYTLSQATSTYTPAGGLLQDLAYEYDLAGNIVQITDITPGSGIQNNPTGALYPLLQSALASGDALVRDFLYDPLNRLISATGRECASIPEPRPVLDDHYCGYNSSRHGTANQDNAPTLTTFYTEQYEYDPAGNMLRLSHRRGAAGGWSRYFGMAGSNPADWKSQVAAFLGGTQVTWTPGGNRLTHFGNAGDARTSHTFDANGNLTQEFSNRHFGWDHADRLIRFADQTAGAAPTKEACYLYGADGIRVKKWVRTSGNASGDESTVYIDSVFEHQTWHKNGQAGQTDHLHVMDNQNRVAIVRVGVKHPDDHGPDVQYHLSDHLGSSAIVVGGRTAQANAFINRQERFSYGETSFGGFGKKRFGLSGKERDEESGLSYHGARYYTSTLACWISSDRFPTIPGTSLYQYASNNPLHYVDMDGNQEGQFGSVAEVPRPSPQQRVDMVQREFIKGVAIAFGEHTAEELVGNLVPAIPGLKDYVQKLAKRPLSLDRYDRSDKEEKSWNPLQQALNEMSVSNEFAGEALDALKAGDDYAAVIAGRNAGFYYGRMMLSCITLGNVAYGGAKIGKAIGPVLKDVLSTASRTMMTSLERVIAGRVATQERKLLESLSKSAESSGSIFNQIGPSADKGKRLAVSVDAELERSGSGIVDALREVLRNNPELRKGLIPSIERRFKTLERSEKALESVIETGASLTPRLR